jgi:hypothetical protein
MGPPSRFQITSGGEMERPAYMSLGRNLSSTSLAPLAPKMYVGQLQPAASRLPSKPPVNYSKGGDDFRCPHDMSSIGAQLTSWPHTATSGRYKFQTRRRFVSESYRSPGPVYDPVASVGKQVSSTRRSNGGVGFGTATRTSAQQIYGIWNAKV